MMIFNNYDPEESSRFSLLASQWWDQDGPLKMLHQLNPLRLAFIKGKIAQHSLASQLILDVGCGGGILTESLACEGASVTGIDQNQSLIEAAIAHQAQSSIPLNLNYQCLLAEEMATQNKHDYDIVACFELLEHVVDPCSVVYACAELVRSGGAVFFSTLNRCFKAYLLAIMGAEYGFKWLPQHTHDYAKFIKPAELSTWMRAVGLVPQCIQGVKYDLLNQRWVYTADVSVNYFFYAKLPNL